MMAMRRSAKVMGVARNSRKLTQISTRPVRAKLTTARPSSPPIAGVERLDGRPGDGQGPA